MKKPKIKIPWLLTIGLLIYISLGMLQNLDLAVKAMEETAEEDAGLAGFVEKTESSYSSEFNPKNLYINLNGMFAKVTGRRVYNEVAVLNNGMLINGTSLAEMDTESAAKRTAAFRDLVESTGGQFLYVQAPYKLDVNNALLPTGVEYTANERADNMLMDLAAYDVNTLDLRVELAADQEALEQYFYRTDHHWNTAGGFRGFQIICSEIERLFPDDSLTSAFRKEDAWKVTTYDNWFLGSQGKRVGQYFAGTDDVMIYEPLQETDMSCYIMNHRTFRKGDFTQVNIRTHYLEERNYFEDNVYCVYIGGDYPLVQHRNASAASDLKVLILKDSFTLPVQAFLSTVFREVDVIDPRYYSDGTLAEYVECNRPDVVILLLNPWSMNGQSYYNTGAEDAAELLDMHPVTAVEKTDFLIEAEDANSARKAVATGLKANTKYALQVDSVSLEEGNTEAAMIVLYNASSESVESSRVIDLDYQSTQDGYVWSFVTPDVGDDDLQLLIYAGCAGNTAGNTVAWHGVSLDRYEQ